MNEGRPTVYSEKIRDEICDRISNGESVRKISRDPHMPGSSTIFRWALDIDHEFWDHYARARVIQAENLVDEVIEIADDSSNDWKTDKDGNEVFNSEHVQRCKLKMEARKWVAGKMHPKMYGDKITQKIEAEVKTTNEIKIDEGQVNDRIAAKLKELGIDIPKETEVLKLP